MDVDSLRMVMNKTEAYDPQASDQAVVEWHKRNAELVHNVCVVASALNEGIPSFIGYIQGRKPLGTNHSVSFEVEWDTHGHVIVRSEIPKNGIMGIALETNNRFATFHGAAMRVFAEGKYVVKANYVSYPTPEYDANYPNKFNPYTACCYRINGLEKNDKSTPLKLAIAVLNDRNVTTVETAESWSKKLMPVDYQLI